jgi:branched-chain amino acid transport system permease protein
MIEGVAVERGVPASRWLAVFAGLGTLALFGLPLIADAAVVRTLVQFFYLLALAQMWNLLAGYAGLVSIGQQAFVGIGAYALLYFADHLSIDLFVSIFLAALVAGALAIPTALLVFRLHGGYFAIGTWVVAEVYRLLIANTQALGGGSGVTITAAVAIDRDVRLYGTYAIALVLGVGSVMLVYLLLRSDLGLALRAVRDRESAAPAVGIDVWRTKLQVYVLASTVCGLAGAVIYANLLRLQPDATFSVNWSAFMIFAVVIGGLGTVAGPIVGTIVYFALQQFLADLGPIYLIVLGLVAVGVMLRAPRGLWGLVPASWSLWLFPVQLRVRRPS